MQSLKRIIVAVFTVYMNSQIGTSSEDEDELQPVDPAVEDKELLSVLETGDIDKFERIMATRRCINEFFYFNELCAQATPIMIACFYGNNDLVMRLIQEGSVELDKQNQKGQSAIYIAAHQGHYDVVRSLIYAQVDVDLQESDGCSPIYIASRIGHIRVVELLIEAQADVNAQDWLDGCSPLYIASQEGHVEVVDLLINAKADVNLPINTGESPIYIASQNDHPKVVDSLIKAGADVNLQEMLDGCTPVYIASQNGHHKVVESLISAGADANLLSNDTSTLYAASHNGHHLVVDLLVKSQADINYRDVDGYSPLYISSCNGHSKVVNLLINAQADLDIRRNTGETPLFIASFEGHQTVVDLLIKSQADVDAQERSGRSPIYVASRCCHHKIVSSLIQAQANVDLQQDTGESPIYAASQQGHHRVVGSLIKARADVNCQQNDGRTPLYIGSGQGHTRVVEILIKAKADVTILTNVGKSPISIASQNGRYEVVEKLIGEYWALPHPAELMEPALRCAQEFGNSRVVQLLSCAQTSASSVKSISDRPIPCDSELSQQLHKMLTQSGFIESRAALQSAAADVLQDILRRRRTDNGFFVVGSFSEGWGNSLKTLDGRTDLESDIDVMQLVEGNLLHPRGFCQCADVQTFEYKNGHLLNPGFASSPSFAWRGSELRPAVDEVLARLLCCYPTIEPLQEDRVCKSNIAESVLRQLRHDLASDASPCHVVHAAPPGKAGEQLRVSTSFLEKRLLRSLNTLQGQLFVALKWLLKKAVRHNGFKSYHAKTPFK